MDFDSIPISFNLKHSTGLVCVSDQAKSVNLALFEKFKDFLVQMLRIFESLKILR